MDELSSITLMTEQDRHIFEVIAEERSRLRNFIRKRVRNEGQRGRSSPRSSTNW
jgi:hypothetical protein